MGKLTISMAMFNSYFDITRGYVSLCHLIWANYNISLTWIVRPFGDDFPNPNHGSSEGEQWGRYNLPRLMVYYTGQWMVNDNDSWW